MSRGKTYIVDGVPMRSGDVYARCADVDEGTLRRRLKAGINTMAELRMAKLVRTWSGKPHPWKSPMREHHNQG